MAAAISAGDLALAMSRANASARLAGSDMNKFIGYVTTVADVTQKSAESVGESFKTIYSRFGNVKAGKFVASQEEMNSSTYNEEEFESLNDIETVLSSIGIKLRENAKEWRDIDDVLQDIADSWDNWDKTTQNAVATAVAGTRQRENVLQLFDNWDEVDKYAEIAANSYGTATEKMKAYTDSVEAAQQRIQVAIEDWALWANGAGVIKDFYNTIGFAIKNIDDLIVVFGALAIALNLGSVISTFSNGLTVMTSKFVDIGMMFDRVKLNLNLSGTNALISARTGKDMLKENFIFAQQQLFANALSQYTSTLNAQDAQAIQNMQKDMLRMDATDKLTVSLNLLSDADTQLLMTQYEKFSDESKKHLANALLLVTLEELIRTILQLIASGKDVSNSEENLEAVNKALALVRQKEYKNALGNVLNKSGKMGDPGKTAAIGVASTIGGVAGAFGLGTLGGLLLGDSGKVYGTMLGSMIGGYAGKSLVGAITGVATGASWTTLLGPIGLALGLVGATGWAIWKKHREKEVEEAQKAFKEVEESYSAMKGANITAKQFDELAKGVDSFGKNVSLTDDEYQDFLDKSNELAELFPELVVRTDEAGNQLVGYANIVGGVTDKVNELIEAERKKNDIALTDDIVVGNALSETLDTVEKYNKEIEKQESRKKQAYNDYKNNTLTEESYNFIVLDADKEIEKINKDIIEATSAMNDYSNAYVRLNKLASETYENMSESEKSIYNSLISGIQLIDEEGNRITTEELKLKSIEAVELAKLIYNSIGEENIEIAFKPKEEYDTTSEMNASRKKLSKSLKEVFGDDYDETERAILYDFGFEVDKDGNLIDTYNLLDKFKNEFNIPISGVLENGMLSISDLDKNANLITLSNLGKLTPDDAAKAYEYMEKGIIDVTDSMDTLVDLLYADREMPTTLEQARQYTEETLSLYSDLNEKTEEFLNTNGWEDANVNEVFSKYPSAIRGSIQEAQEAFKKGELNTEDFLDSIESMTASKMIEIMGNLGEVEIQSVFGEDFLGDIDGHINTLGELKSALSEVANTYNTLADAQKEQSLYGKLSLQTVIDLLSSNINYAQVLDFVTEGENGNITACKLKSDAQKTMVDLLLQAVRTNLQAAMAEEANTIALNNHRLSILGTTDGQIQLEGETDNLIAVNEAATQSTGQLSATLNGLGAALNEIVHLRFTNVKKAYDLAYNATLESLGELDKVDWEKRYEGLTKDQVDAEIAKLKLSNELAKSRYDAYKLSYNELGNAIQTGNYTGLGEDFGLDVTGKDGKTPLEKLQELESAINKEREAMRVFGTGKETAYFEKMKANLSLQKDMLKNLVATAKTDEERLDYQKQLEEVEVKIANLDDELLEDKKKNLETLGATLGAQIAIQRELIKASDTEEELIERQKELNDLLKQEQELRRNINNYQRELIDTALEYESASPEGEKYKLLVNQKQALYKEDKIKAKLAIQDARNEAYLSFKNSQDKYDDFGNAKYTDAELWDLANNSEGVQEAVKNYIEVYKGAAELAMKVVDDNINAIDKKLDKLENKKPSEWIAISDIDDYYDNKIELLNDKIDVWQKALKETSDLTDEQITSLVDSLNDATKAIQEAKIAKLEDEKAIDDKYYEAITWQVNQYVEELEKAKKVSDKWYDDEVKKLLDYNENLDRTNLLLELQNKLKLAQTEKQRVNGYALYKVSYISQLPEMVKTLERLLCFIKKERRIKWVLFTKLHFLMVKVILDRPAEL